MHNVKLLLSTIQEKNGVVDSCNAFIDVANVYLKTYQFWRELCVINYQVAP